MPSYVLMTKLPAGAIKSGSEFKELAKRVGEKIKTSFPQVKWCCSYAVMGPYDVVDVFEAPDNETATKVALIIRQEAGAITETYPAAPWDEFLKSVEQM